MLVSKEPTNCETSCKHYRLYLHNGLLLRCVFKRKKEGNIGENGIAINEKKINPQFSFNIDGICSFVMCLCFLIYVYFYNFETVLSLLFSSPVLCVLTWEIKKNKSIFKKKT